ncbi:lasso peptide biosynthesis B2 protein [Solimonas sp. SE-A11]|uniref:lasso peptide biosynthesis B2 protein n=1 Tax=Solimonas sp. SE-A11 TaxID=3054954 RepID=UPI00259CBE06|nr:lasso peptide biosynthesis B2 protein [Solimonas sp. SE-A11]
MLADDLLAVEALAALGLARLALLLPYRHYRPWLELRSDNPGTAPEMALRIARAVRRAARVAPWSAVCLPQAMAGKLMLQRRNIGCCLVLGVENTQPGILLHAWLEVDGNIIIGAAGADRCAVLNRYGNG